MISYAPLFRTMKEKGITTYKLFQMGFPSSTYYYIKNGNNMTMKTLDQLCILLDCEVSDIIKYVKDTDLKS